MWLVYALFSAVTASLVAIFGKLGSPHLDMVVATTMRSMIMTGLLMSVCLVLKKPISPWSFTAHANDWMYIFLAGIAGALSWLFYFSALQTGAVAKVVAIDRLSLVFTVVLSALVLHEAVTLKALAGVVLMSIGSLLLLL